MIFFKFDDLHQQNMIVLGMVHAQIKEHVMMQQEPVFASKGLKDFQELAKVKFFVFLGQKNDLIYVYTYIYFF
jgi:predicted nucleic acid-binding Zn finger protein